jgi:hypothetical protein
MTNDSVPYSLQLFVHVNRQQCPIETALLTCRGLLNDEKTASLPQLLFHYRPVSTELNQRHQRNESRVIVCSTCQHTLGHQHNILQNNDYKSLDEKLTVFVAEFLDPFWQGYRPVHGHVRLSSVASVGTEGAVAEPLEWMIAQAFSTTPRTAPTSGGVSHQVQPDLKMKKRSIAACQEEEDSADERSASSSYIGSGELHCPQCQASCGYIRTQCLPLCLKYVLVDLFVLRKESFQNKRILHIDKSK